VLLVEPIVDTDSPFDNGVREMLEKSNEAVCEMATHIMICSNMSGHFLIFYFFSTISIQRKQ
jgi:hypothetical protein